ncbi:hypothetical protein BC826DRAFT_922011, partial [Russula brevipes]
TLRRHLEASHAGKYRNWAKGAKFISKLPGDIKKRKVAEEAMHTLDRDLREKEISERIVPYSDRAFRRVAIEWLVATDQPIQAFEHPKFKELINITSRATRGVVIPSRKSTHTKIMHMFKDHFMRLKAQLGVCMYSIAP